MRNRMRNNFNVVKADAEVETTAKFDVEAIKATFDAALLAKKEPSYDF